MAADQWDTDPDTFKHGGPIQMTNDDLDQQWCRIIVKLCERGASLRTIAKVVGMSKSTLHRQMPAIKAIAETSRLGQNRPLEGPAQRSFDDGLSHLGQTP